MSGPARKVKDPEKTLKKNRGNTYYGADYGPVTWEELSNLRQNSVILFKSVRYPNKISEWTLRAGHMRESRSYVCVLCRRIQNKGRRGKPPVNFGPGARILVRNGRFLVHPDNPLSPHVCGFAENPLSDRAAVLARRMMIRARAEITEDGLTAKQKMMQILERLRTDEKYSDLSEQEIALMEEICRGKVNAKGWSDSSTAHALYINRRKLTSLRHCDLKKIFECPITGCSFVTTLRGMIDVHISETHKTADGNPEPSHVPAQSQALISEADCDGRDCPLDELSDFYDEDDISVDVSVTSPDEDESCSKDFGPVLYESISSSRENHGPIIIYYSRRYMDKISEWSLSWDEGVNEIMHYECVLCRRVIDRARKSNSTEEPGPPAQISVFEGRFLTDPDYPDVAHVCNFAENPLSNRESVLARRTSIRKRKLVETRKCKNISDGEIVDATEDCKMLCERRTEPIILKKVEHAFISWNSQTTHSARSGYRSFSLTYDYPATSGKPVFKNDRFDSRSSRRPGHPLFTRPRRVPMKFIHRPISAGVLQRRAVGEAMETVHDEFYCSIVGCNYRAKTVKALDEHLRRHEILDERTPIAQKSENEVHCIDEDHICAVTAASASEVLKCEFDEKSVPVNTNVEGVGYDKLGDPEEQQEKDVIADSVDVAEEFTLPHIVCQGFHEEPILHATATRMFEEVDDEVMLDVVTVDEEEFGEGVAYECEVAGNFEYRDGRFCGM